MELASLAIDPKELEAKTEAAEAPCDADIPRYPYGTALYLDDTTLAALGVKEMPATGTLFRVVGIAKVTGTSEREFETSKGVEKRRTLDLQITDMGLEGGKKQTFKDAASTLYSKAK